MRSAADTYLVVRQSIAAVLTRLVDVVLARLHLGAIAHRRQINVFSDRHVKFREYEYLVARDVELLQGFADDALRFAVGVCVGSVPLGDSISTTDTCRKRFAFFTVLRPRSYAALSSSRDSFSSSTHFAQPGVPRLIAPRMGTETLSPLRPRRCVMSVSILHDEGCSLPCTPPWYPPPT